MLSFSRPEPGPCDGRARPAEEGIGRRLLGSSFEKKLRKHIEACDVFISLLSTNSLESLFCAFEMGAAWGHKTLIKPILLPGLAMSQLQRPLSSSHSFTWSDAAGWIQLVDEVAEETYSEIYVNAGRVAQLAKRIANYKKD